MKKPSASQLTPLLIWLAVALLFEACQQQAAPPAGFFPDSNTVSGWTKSAEVRTFAPQQLSEYIDGDAEKYLKAGVKTTATTDYKYRGETDVVVDIYTMSTAAAAKAVFDSEPAMDAEAPTLGDSARLYSQSLIFRKGPYLVRMVAYQESPQLARAMLELGRALESKLIR
jgi:hypothetical protein